MHFKDLGLSAELLAAIEESGYTTPTPIQEQAIPVALQGRDVLGIAQTGTGKTAGFVLPMIEMLSQGRARARMPRSLILEPTRELAAQVAEQFAKYGKNHRLTTALLIGGVSFGDQDDLLRRGVDVLIATPGRLLDQFERGKILMSGVQLMVVDEADRMLDMGFIPDIERIFKMTPFTRQTLFFSATMPPEIQRLTEQFLHNPEKIEVARPATAATTITQRLYNLGTNAPEAKRAALRHIIKNSPVTNGIVFCNRKRDVDIVAKSLEKHGFSVAPIHGDLPQSTRTQTLERFRGGELQLLVASDVAARGLDIPLVSHVFNFDVPFHADDYVHRIGRTGRAGRSGEAVMLVTPHDEKFISAINSLTGMIIEEGALEGLAEAMAAAPRREYADKGDRRGGRDSRGRAKSGGRGRDRFERGPRPEARAPDGDAAEESFEIAAVEYDAPDVAEPAIEADGGEQRKPRRSRNRGRGKDAARPADVRASSEDGPPQEREDRPEREPRQETRSEARPPRPRSEDRPDKKRREHSGAAEPVGFGEHVPAFLRNS
ncbi:MAG: DEAD/DEAH box helicase [Caulobacterales bacterium]